MIAREPAVAGMFYPGDPKDLRRIIQKYAEPVAEPESVRAAIVPHAGYVYSGPVAGKVISSIRIPGEVLILGPNHTGRGAVLSLYPGGSWATPLGEVQISSRMNRAILRAVNGVAEDKAAHSREHCAEVQVPFLQMRNPDVKISVLIFGTGELDTLLEVGEGVARVVENSPEPVLILSSSDMTHYEPQETAKEKDQLAIDEILRMDPEGLHRTIRSKKITRCGYAPTVAAMKAARELGATSARLVDYRTSGDETGDYDAVVGYAGILIP